MATEIDLWPKDYQPGTMRFITEASSGDLVKLWTRSYCQSYIIVPIDKAYYQFAHHPTIYFDERKQCVTVNLLRVFNACDGSTGLEKCIFDSPDILLTMTSETLRVIVELSVHGFYISDELRPDTLKEVKQLLHRILLVEEPAKMKLQRFFRG